MTRPVLLFRLLFSVLLLTLSFNTYAMLDLELTQGMTAAIPIALPSFSGDKAIAAGNESVDQIIQNDLQNSGEFRVVSGDPPATAVKATDLNHYWKKQGADDVLIGDIQKSGRNSYRITLQLNSVYSNSVLFSDTFNVSGAAGLRQLAHHISDLVYQQLTGTPGVFSTKIAYILVTQDAKQQETYRLMVADADGFNPQALLTSSQPIMSPSWSPDGKQLAYVSFEKGDEAWPHAAIYLQNLASGQRQVISEAPGINGAPAFSPDGTKLAYVLSITGNPKIYVMDLNTKKRKEITFGWSIDTEPDWSYDGKSILFTSNRDGSPQIYSYHFANAQITRLTYNGSYNARAAFLPNDQSIIMMHRDDGMFTIAKQNNQTSQLEELTQTGSAESPSIAPNGKIIIYATQYGGRGVLAQVSVDGRIKLRLPAGEGDVREPAWSPYLH